LACQLVAFGRATAAAVVWRARQVNLPQPVMDRDLCAGVAFTHVNRIPDRVMCTQTAANAAPCGGNLGSGLYCNGLLTGVLTAGINCNNTPAVYQQVRAYNDWINEQFLRNDMPTEAGTVPFNVQGSPVFIRS